MVRGLALLLGYAVIAAMGIALIGLAVSAMVELALPWGASVAIALAAFVAGAVGAIAGVRYELAAPTPGERIRRHVRMQTASVVTLGIAVLLFLIWSLLPALVRVAAASAGAGYVLGFLVVFIPNRRKALEIRDLTGTR